MESPLKHTGKQLKKLSIQLTFGLKKQILSIMLIQIILWTMTLSDVLSELLIHLLKMVMVQ